NLVAGNPVIVKPHPGAILPIAMAIAAIQRVLQAHGQDPQLCQLAADTPEQPMTKLLAEHPAVKLIDYTGGSAFGRYVESLPGKTVFTEKAGVNSVILDSVTDLDAVLQNLAFSVCLYSGQMCTAPQNFFIPETGVGTPAGKVGYAEVCQRFSEAVQAIVNNPKMGAGTLGALQNKATLDRALSAGKLGGTVLLAGTPLPQEAYPQARSCTPSLLQVSGETPQVFEKELFGPVVLLIKTHDTADAIRLARNMAEKHGAITCAAYTTDATVKEQVVEEMNRVFTPVSLNFTGPIWVNQHAAFSDFHVTGGNPAGNASFTNPEFINRRFVWIGNREVIN
ncbi:MAG TPA: aldehyde dehydrogenase family protein, partial [Chitinophaga sp.]